MWDVGSRRGGGHDGAYLGPLPSALPARLLPGVTFRSACVYVVGCMLYYPYPYVVCYYCSCCALRKAGPKASQPCALRPAPAAHVPPSLVAGPRFPPRLAAGGATPHAACGPACAPFDRGGAHYRGTFKRRVLKEIGNATRTTKTPNERQIQNDASQMRMKKKQKSSARCCWSLGCQ